MTPEIKITVENGRTIFSIDVGNLPKEDVIKFLNSVKDKR